MKEIYGDFEYLVFIYLHHYQDVFEAHVTDLYCLLAASHCFFKPVTLILEKLRVKISNASSQYLKDIPILLPDCIKHLMYLFFLIGDGNEGIEFLCHSLKHEEILPFFIFIIAVNRKTGNFNKTSKGMISEIIGREHESEFINQIRVDDVVHGYPAEEGIQGF